MRVVVLIPARNEADRVAQTLQALYSLNCIVVGCIVVDDASSDETGQRAQEAGALVGRLPYHQGKGAALNHACEMLETLKPFGSLDSLDAVLLIDADLASSAQQADALITALQNADMSIASFPPAAKKAGFGIVKSLAHDAILEMGGFDARSPLSGQRALTIPCLKAVRPFAEGFGIEVDMSIRALWAQMRLVEVPTTMTHRASGRTLRGFIHRGRQLLDVERAIRKLAKEQKHR